jgi:hypothetical protein
MKGSKNLSGRLWILKDNKKEKEDEI